MARSYLESMLVLTLPSFAGEWENHRRMYPPGSAPDDAQFLATLRAHVVSLLSDGRVAETTRFFYALERLLGDADPILRELLERDLVLALARDCLTAGIDSRRIQPYLGSKTTSLWGE